MDHKIADGCRALHLLTILFCFGQKLGNDKNNVLERSISLFKESKPFESP